MTRESGSLGQGKVVLHLPLSPFNVYQDLMCEALAARGVTVRKIPFKEIYGWFPLARNRARACAIMHLHWPHGFYQTKRLYRALVKAAIFWLEMKKLRAQGIRLVWEVHDRGSHDVYHPCLDALVFNWLAGFSDRVVVHCEAARRWVEKDLGAPPDRVRVIPHGSFRGYYPDAVLREQARQELAIPAEAKVLLFFGSLRVDKGIPELLAAFSRLAQPDLRLVVAGWVAEPRPAEVLKTAAEKDPRIQVYPELIPDERVQYFLRAADVVVMPYREILTSGVLTLARDFRVPVVAPAMGCLPEQLGSAAGVLYDPATPAALEQAILTALEKSPEAWPLPDPAEEANLQWPKIAESLLAIYEEVDKNFETGRGGRG